MDLLPLEERLREALNSAISFNDICFRNVAVKYSAPDQALSTVGSQIIGGRYNFIGAFGVLYLSCDLHICLEETTHANRDGNLAAANALPRVMVAIEVRLTKVLDLTDPLIQSALGITEQTLTGTDWERIQEEEQREAITQGIGRLAREIGFEAILVPSAVYPGKNLNVFIDKLESSSRIFVMNSDQLPTT